MQHEILLGSFSLDEVFNFAHALAKTMHSELDWWAEIYSTKTLEDTTTKIEIKEVDYNSFSAYAPEANEVIDYYIVWQDKTCDIGFKITKGGTFFSIIPVFKSFQDNQIYLILDDLTTNRSLMPFVMPSNNRKVPISFGYEYSLSKSILSVGFSRNFVSIVPSFLIAIDTEKYKWIFFGEVTAGYNNAVSKDNVIGVCGKCGKNQKKIILNKSKHIASFPLKKYPSEAPFSLFLLPSFEGGGFFSELYMIYTAPDIAIDLGYQAKENIYYNNTFFETVGAEYTYSLVTGVDADKGYNQRAFYHFWAFPIQLEKEV